MIYFISDTHFGDWTILPYCKMRLFSDPKQRDDLIIQNTSHITDYDIVYHLGDVGPVNPSKESMMYALSCLEKIRGHKRLIMGNHDSEYPNKVCEDPVKFWMKHGFERVYDRPIIMDESEHNLDVNIYLSHIPPMFANDPHLYFFGHIHMSPQFKTISGNSACVCTERWDYSAPSMNDVLEQIKYYRENDKFNDIIITK